ncbi:hypothetical protein N2152v2_008480 [Parachlorella kessleri]
MPPQQLYLSAQQRCQAPRKAERLPVLDQVGTWPAFSPVDPQHVTLVTQLNLERLDMLENQCKVWPHALAAAVYVPLLDGLVASLDSPELNGIRLAQALEVLGSFHARLQSEGACNLELALFAERCTDQGMAGLYPFNAMRNKALQMVQTEVVFQLDVDFLVNKEFGEEVGSPAGWAALRQQLALAPALVLPAFEPNATQLQMRPTSKQHAEHGDEVLEKQLQLGKAMALEAVEAGKGWVVAKYAARELQQFAIVKFEAGHNCTQYSRWLQAQDFYEINYTNGYEPYTLMLRKHIPWFDERFRGYGFDKMTGYLVMWHWGIRFAVHPRAFVVHVPHPVAKTLALTKRLNNYVKLRQMFIDALKDLLQHQYFPVTSFPERCPLRPGVQQQLSVEDITYAVKSKYSKEGTLLLRNVSGYLRPGELAAVMGPSGSGKSTLLDLLSGRKTVGSLTGEIKVAGTVATRTFLRRFTGYVEQSASLLDTLTVHEVLMYTAQLKRPMPETTAQKEEAVSQLLRILALESCRDVKIGSSLRRGISGGQAKRVSIAIALVTAPRILFMDEPTSGLDSYMANEVMRAVKNLAGMGITLVSSIHSPTPFCFNQFDRVLLLLRGSVIYFGPNGKLLADYFHTQCLSGLGLREGDNLADWIVDLTTQGDSKGAAEGFASAFVASDLKRIADAEIAEQLQHLSMSSEPHQKDLAVRVETVTPIWWGIIILLQYRSLKNFRNPEWVIPRIGSQLVFSFIIATAYWQLGDDLDLNNVINLSACLFMWTILAGYGALPYTPSLVLDRPLFVRERNDGLYRVLTYLSHKMIEEVALALLLSIIFSAVVFYTLAFEGSYVLFWLVHFVSLANGIALAYFIAAVSPNMDAAASALLAYVTSLLFFSGCLLRWADIPEYWRWYSYINFLRYSWGALMVNQYEGDRDVQFLGGLTVLQYHDLEGVNKWVWLGIETSFFVVFFFLASLGLTFVSHDISYAVKTKHSKDDTLLLRNVSGYLRPGELAALMGPSGSGKSTLLDLLSGRKTVGSLTGEIKIAGAVPTRTFLRRFTGYVEQSVSLLDVLTVQEVLMYTAQLKRPMHETTAQKEAAVNQLLRILALESCRDVKIGSSLQRGISGGQAKRVNIAIALVTAPRILFMDEPTSGLDSYMANEVIRVVKNLAGMGITLVSSIHSPTPFCFNQFDRVLLLLRGSVIYFGPNGKLLADYFQNQCPLASGIREGDNLAEWIVDLTTQGDSKEEAKVFASAFAASDLKRIADAEIADQLQQSSMLSKQELKDLAVRRETVTPIWWGILILLRYRSLKNFRSPVWVIPRIGSKLVFSIIIFTAYWKLGDDLDLNNVINLGACLFMWTILAGYGALPYTPALVLDRPLFVRERSDGLYRVITYLSHKMVEELVLALLLSIIFSALVFYTLALEGSYVLFWLVYFFSLANGIALAYFVAAVSPNMDTATAALLAYITSLLFFTGCLLRWVDIPNYWRWYAYINFLRYSWGALMVNQYGGGRDVEFIGGLTVLEYHDLEGVNKWVWLGIETSFFLVFFFLAFLGLTFVSYVRR